MRIVHVAPVESVIGPLGEKLTREKLPSPSTSRWVARRKAEVVKAVEGGLLTVPEACARYGLSFEELAAWQRDYARGGVKGLNQANVASGRKAAGKKSERHRGRREILSPELIDVVSI